MRSFPFKVKTEDIRAALRVGVSVGVPLLALYALGQIHFAVYAAFGALASLYGHSETIQRRVETQLVAGAALVATLAAAAVYSATQGPEWLLSLMLPIVVVGTGTLGTVMGWVPRGEIFFILVLLVIAGIPLTPNELLPAIAVGTGGAGFSVLLTLLEPSSTVDTRTLLYGVRRRTQIGSAALDRTRHAIVITLAALAATAAWLLALALDIGHPFWAPIAVAALMPALTPADAMRRTIHLMMGTLGGVGIAAVLFMQEPGPLALILIIALCQAVAELFLARNYGVALLFITPLAIGMSNLGRNLPWSPLLMERLVEAGLGAAIALVAIIIGSMVLTNITAPRINSET
ncbi:FUSC family protein [Ancylobacter defluvii]|uniref:FUSC family protein n=1 Tax=Ancylobacter defluvii TaxID=1282440 RepID=A0A9W6NCL3_9HYPH|nr:FUSC family protein [Ancylobacter defluvii]MBS7586483.1 FUSC family protein [Ancylobacter defluvii]GLK85765.1 FUSC family protein [Ancylobacter defluvii]